MKERPILFSAPMVRALLAGAKTQTRRIVKPALSGREWVEQRESGDFWRCADGDPTCYTGVWETHEYEQQSPIRCPHGEAGDFLWVRETFQRFSEDGYTLYKADPQGFKEMNNLKRDECLEARWRPSIHMPRALSRITLRITGVRVERLQDISEADALAEGVNVHPDHHGKPSTSIYSPVQAYRDLWESINGPGSWDANPWVWVVDFEVVKP